MTSKEAMSMGTAGFSAMLAIMRLEELGMKKENGEVLVTGATGGVGSVAHRLTKYLDEEICLQEVVQIGELETHPPLL